MNLGVIMILRLRRIAQLSLIVTLLIGIAAAPVLAQARIIGRVVNEEALPIEGALVIAENANMNPPRIDTSTSADGRYAFIGFRSGTWAFMASKEGFHDNIIPPVVIVQGDNPPVNFTLKRIRHPLELAIGEDIPPSDLEILERELQAADDAYVDQNWDAAIAGYTSILEKLPQMFRLNLQIGNANRQNENYEAALAAYELLKAADPTNEQVDTELARTKLAMGDFEAASIELAAAASGLDAQREDLYNLGEIEFVKGAVDEAAKWYEKATMVDPSWGKPLFKLALVSLNRGDIETAKEYFKKVLAVDPDSEEGVQAKATLAALP